MPAMFPPTVALISTLSVDDTSSPLLADSARRCFGAERLEGGGLGLRMVTVDGVHGAAGVLDVQGGAAGVSGDVAGIDVELRGGGAVTADRDEGVEGPNRVPV